MTSHYSALYDACVLYPAPLRDILVELATTDMFRGRWTNQIHDEWIRNVLKNRPDLKEEQLIRTKELMNQHARDPLIEGYEALIPTLELPDEGDCHVLAAAIRGQCDVIVTMNLKHFPKSVLSIYDIEAQHPDRFIADLIDLYPRKVLSSVQIVQKRLKNPPKSFSEYLDTLLKQGLTETESMLREVSFEI
ncbi:MAG: PIN domain-containing protein [Cyanobacteria bacterium SBLK]|nr:PIN domain-containing protein [Cyanobacteria bacterium SBLK]